MVSEPELIARLYRSIHRIRRVEEEIARVYPTDKIKSPVHLSIGQEAVAVGACDPLRPDDVVFGTYRNHAVYLAKGGDLRAMIAELYGKVTGCARGKGGSMHLIDTRHGVMGASAVVATTIPHAVGFAYAMKAAKSDRLVMAFFGEGAAEEGAFHESMNFAALKRLPVIFICENNFYAIHSHQRARQHEDNLVERAKSYGMSAERIEGSDVLAIREKVSRAAADLRAGAPGPRFFECMTYRWKEHVGPGDDWHLGYRTYEEARPWIEGDAVLQLRRRLDAGLSKAIDVEVEAEIQKAFEFAESSSFPDPAELYTDVLAELP